MQTCWRKREGREMEAAGTQGSEGELERGDGEKKGLVPRRRLRRRRRGRKTGRMKGKMRGRMSRCWRLMVMLYTAMEGRGKMQSKSGPREEREERVRQAVSTKGAMTKVTTGRKTEVDWRGVGAVGLVVGR